MEIGEEVRRIEVEEPAFPFEGEEVSPGFRPEKAPVEEPVEVG
jgi:hypothetical protein